MKDLLKEKYKIEIDNYYVYKDGIIFFLDGFRYYFVKHDYDDEFSAESPKGNGGGGLD